MQIFKYFFCHVTDLPLNNRGPHKNGAYNEHCSMEYLLFPTSIRRRAVSASVQTPL